MGFWAGAVVAAQAKGLSRRVQRPFRYIMADEVCVRAVPAHAAPAHPARKAG